MSTFKRGDYSVKVASTPGGSGSGNKREFILNGSGAGEDGVRSLQRTILLALQPVLAHIGKDAEYTIERVVETAVSSGVESLLFHLPAGVTDNGGVTPGRTAIQDFLKKVDALTQATTTPITDAGFVEFVTSLVNEIFTPVVCAMKVVEDTTAGGLSLSSTEGMGRINKSVSNNLFSFEVVVY